MGYRSTWNSDYSHCLETIAAITEGVFPTYLNPNYSIDLTHFAPKNWLELECYSNNLQYFYSTYLSTTHYDQPFNDQDWGLLPKITT
jgi:hypothetical protein